MIRSLAAAFAFLVSVCAFAQEGPGPVPSIIAAGACLSANGVAGGTLNGSGTLSTTQPQRSVSAGSTDTILASDNCGTVRYAFASTGSVALPAASTAGFNSFSVSLWNDGPGSVTVVPSSGTLAGRSSLIFPAGTGCRIASNGSTGYNASGGCTALIPVYFTGSDQFFGSGQIGRAHV